ncbi:MAG: MinD/ParA family protein [Chitinophagales bacterium]
MKDQADKLRNMANNLKNKIEADISTGFKHARVIVITSGKGGVGKTNIAINLSIIMSQMGCRVILMDADMGLANVDIVLGISPRHNLYHVLKKEKEIKDIIISGPNGVRIVPGGSGIVELANLPEKDIKSAVTELGKLDLECEYLIIDTGAGLSNNVMSFVVEANEIIVVTTPEPTALTDAYGIIKAASAREAKGKIFVIVNRAASEAEGVLVGQKLKSIANKFLDVDVDVLGHIIDDRSVEESVRRQEPFVLRFPNSGATKDLKIISRRICEITFNDTSARPAGLRSFFKNLVTNLWK